MKRTALIVFALLLALTLVLSACGAKGATDAQGEKGEQGATDAQGEKGEQSATDAQGEKGETGATGATDKKDEKDATGAAGKSAYEIWLEEGHTGTQADFLEWLKGEPGEQGETDVGIESVEVTPANEVYIVLNDKAHTRLFVHQTSASEGLNYDIRDGEVTITGKGACTDTDIVIPHSIEGYPVTKIGYTAFRATSIRSVVISDSVTEIGEYAFDNCSELANVVFPDTLTTIGGSAFSSCTALTSIAIPEGVTSIGNGAFLYCDNLTRVDITDLAAWCNIEFKGSTSANPLHCAHNLYLNGTLKTTGEFVIPDGVTGIGQSAFAGCENLTSVIIPEGVTSIGAYAFEGCTALTSVSIPDSMTNIDKQAFYNCTNLAYQIEGNAKYLGNENNHHVALIEVNSSVTSFIIPSGTKMVAEYVFTSCKENLTNIAIPASVTSIGNGAFFYCSKLQEVIFVEGSQLSSIGDYAFSGCAGLTSVTIPNSVTSIGYEAFSGCTALTSIAIPEGVTSIRYDAFSGCAGLTSITSASPNYPAIQNCLIEASTGILIAGCMNSVIPTDGSVTAIGRAAFYGCSGLTSITIPDSVTSIGEGAFYGCTNLAELIVAEGNSVYHSAGNCIIQTASKTLIAGCKTSVIPTDGSVTAIGSYAFYGCTGLTSITIPDSVTGIGERAFSGCTGLTSVTIPDSLTSIGNLAFSGCTGLTSITIPDSVTSIGNWAFDGCPIETATIPATACSYIKNSNLKTVVITSGTSIGDSALRDCSGLTSVTIPNSVTSIGEGAFYGCTGLESVTIPEGVTSIGDWAFYGCTGLTSITFDGTQTQWNAIAKGFNWNLQTGAYTVSCTQ